MCCPFFEPAQPREGRPRDSMLPLGGAWTGVCRANPNAAREPAESQLRPLCNIGYARDTCPLFPGADAPDAVRFTVSRDNGSTLSLYYVIERDHLPFAHGALEFLPAQGAFSGNLPESMLAAQAGAYASSYLRRRKTEASPR